MIGLKESDTIESIIIENAWNFSQEKEKLMHSIHSYPAKFPAFIASKAFEYAEEEGVDVQCVADIFCGCGTVALEAKLHSKHFWGCDINPVAILIAKTKSSEYSIEKFNNYYREIKKRFFSMDLSDVQYENANIRLQYWFSRERFLDVLRLKRSIMMSISKDDIYLNAFLCVFSSILKGASRWLTKSIKPQVDPDKSPKDVWYLFDRQCQKFLQAIGQIQQYYYQDKDVDMICKNFLEITKLPKVDMIVSSPPYVTSYEYADLHQLSSLWLDYAEDYRTLRQGSIGSLYNSGEIQLENTPLNPVGLSIVQDLKNKQGFNRKVRAVARYYADIERAISKCAKMLNTGGMALFVVGDTEYKGVKIRNAEHLICCLRENGFSNLKASKRKISNKLLTPYRDKEGRFSSDKRQREIYHEEFVISGRMDFQ